MTPFKLSMKSLYSSSDANVSMDADDSHSCTESMLSSPPKQTPRSRLRPATFASRLFADDDNDDDAKTHSHNEKKGGVLKPLDLNLELLGEDAHHGGSSDMMSTSSSHRKPQQQPLLQRKRHAEQHIGRDLSFEDVIDSPVGMHESPRISPTCYRSPSQYRNAHKSPNSYRTLDGRTVQSKNPFSPMNMEETTPAKVKPVELGDSLTFPVSFEDKEESSGLPTPLLRHRLHKRDTLLDTTSFQQWSAHSYNSFTRDGYPERQGRYSFTGSPIKEGVDFDNNDATVLANSHKVRRLHKGDDVVAAASHEPQHYKHNLQVDTTNINYYGSRYDEVSPTDVLSFPMMSPSSPGVPPTPSKPKHYRRRPKTRYTPVRNTAVPQTPMPERRPRARSFDQDDDADDDDHGGSTIQQQQQPNSRFYSDFDVLGELGKGSFGNVFKVLSRLDGCMYAIKVAHRTAKGQADKDRMLKEVYALAALSDQADTATFHIVRYHQAWMEENRLYIQTELCTTTLSAEMRQGPLTVQRRYKFLREISLALEYIHKNDMVHLDIKPENIFIKNDQFKLGDFGLVSKVSSHDVEEGDSRYMSIELLSGNHTDLTKSDIFSLGIALYEVCLGGRSLPTNGPEWQALRSANIADIPSTPADMQRILKLMMNPSYSARPCASDLLKRPQLLSDEQKALLAERNKVVQATLALAAQTNRLRMLNPAGMAAPPPAPPPRGRLVRANTWNGG